MSQRIPITAKYTLFSLTGIIALIDVVTSLRYVYSQPAVFQDATNQELVQSARNLFGIEHKGIKPEGVLYKIKNGADETVGYPFGTFHAWDLLWESLRNEVNAKLNKSTDVYFEIDMKTIPQTTISVDLEVWNLAQGKNLHFLETIDEQMKVLKPYLPITQANSNKISSFQESLEAWQAGDETPLDVALRRDYDVFAQINQEQTFHSVFSDRNKTWFNQHFRQQLLASSKTNKFFVCVGVFHLGDIKADDKGLGLKTLIRQAGFTLTKV